MKPHALAVHIFVGLLAISGCKSTGETIESHSPTPAAKPSGPASGTADALRAEADKAIDTDALIAWRRHFHQYPELSNREVETSKYIAARLRELGLSPKTGIAGNGVVAVIEGG